MRLNTTFVLIIALLAYFVLPIFLLLIKNKRAKNITLWCLFAIYACVLLVGVWAQVDVSKQFVNISFDFSTGWANKQISWTFKNLTTFDICINLIMFIPVGMMVWIKTDKLSWLKKLPTLLIVGLICGLFVEISQFILPVPRSVQFSDVIFNTISVLIGGIVCWFYQTIISACGKNKKDKNQIT